MRKNFKFVFFTVSSMLVASSSYAQSEQSRSASAAEALSQARQYPLRIESGMNVSIPLLPGSTPEEQIKQLATARGLLYQVAAQDCDNIKQAFIADCKILNVRINSNIQSRGPSGGETMYVNSSTTYEVSIRQK